MGGIAVQRETCARQRLRVRFDVLKAMYAFAVALALFAQGKEAKPRTRPFSCPGGQQLDETLRARGSCRGSSGQALHTNTAAAQALSIRRRQLQHRDMHRQGLLPACMLGGAQRRARAVTAERGVACRVPWQCSRVCLCTCDMCPCQVAADGSSMLAALPACGHTARCARARAHA